jgi:plasmid replication initiation protein
MELVSYPGIKNTTQDALKTAANDGDKAVDKVVAKGATEAATVGNAVEDMFKRDINEIVKDPTKDAVNAATKYVSKETTNVVAENADAIKPITKGNTKVVVKDTVKNALYVSPLVFLSDQFTPPTIRISI